MLQINLAATQAMATLLQINVVVIQAMVLLFRDEVSGYSISGPHIEITVLRPLPFETSLYLSIEN
jgi:hypothetical protein